MSRIIDSYKKLDCEVLEVVRDLYQSGDGMWWKRVAIDAEGTKMTTEVGYTNKDEAAAIVEGSTVTLWMFGKES